MEVGIQWPLVLFTLIAGAGYGTLAASGVAVWRGGKATACDPSRSLLR